MKHLQSALLAVAALVLIAGTGRAQTTSKPTPTALVGIVKDGDGHYVNDVYVRVFGSDGKKVTDARTDLYGRYCVPLKPGKYLMKFDPAKTKYRDGSAQETVEVEGLTLNWKVDEKSAAVPSADNGVVSAALGTCGAAYWPAGAAGLGAIAAAGDPVATGGATGAGAAGQTVGSANTSNAPTASAVVGLVSDSNNNYINGVYIEVLDSDGKKVGDGRTDFYGRYCIPVKPGKYTFVLDPGNTKWHGGSAVGNVDIEGLTIDWQVSETSEALASSQLGVASAATATCGGAWWEAAGAAALAGGAIGGIIWGVTGGGGGGHHGSSSPAI
ncbi:MAG TPA: hypothetical protein VEJ86_04180 [Candidatus Binataceae bacterium]|nr:hypothetical protein [Candidatus Binataceae bacterium]